MPMSLRRKTKPVLSSKDRRSIEKKVAARLSLETLEKRELLAADLVGGLADLAEGEGDPKVQMRLIATDLQGQPLDTLYINQAFHLNGYVKDLRADAKGAFTSYMDIDFHKGLVEAIGAISHAEPYNNFKSGSVDVSGSLGVIDEVGGMAGLTELGGDERLVFTVPMRAIGAGTVVFDGNAADTLPAHQVLVYGENDEVPPSLITFADLSLEISDLGSLPYSEDFNDGSADAMTVTQGSFEIQQNRYQSTPANAQDTAITVIDLTADIPSKTRFQSTINLEYANNRRRNAHLVFAYQDADNYKFAGLNAESRRWVISEVVNGQTRELRRSNVNPTQNKNYQLELVIDGSRATLSVDGVTKVANTFSGNLNVGKFGLLADGANSRFDNVHISEIFPVPLSEQDVAETVKGQSITINVLANDSHEQDGAALHIVSVEGVDNATVELQDNNSDNKADVLVFTPDSDFTGSEIFTYVVGDSNGQTDSADVLVDVLPGIPLEEDFSSESPAGFEVVTGNWRVENGAYVAQNRGGRSLAKIRTGAVNPTETEFSATISMPRVSGYNSNVELVFDYVDGDNYKFVGGSVDSRMWYLGKVSNGQRSVTQTVRAEIGRQEYQLAVVIRGKSLTFEVGEETVLSHDYEVAPNVGLFGLAANRAKPVVDDIRIREFVPAPVAEDDAVQTVVNTPVDIAVLGNDGHETDGTFIYIESVSSVENGTAELKDTNDDGKNDTITFTPATDYRGTTSLEYVVRDNAGQTDRGDVLITVAAALPLEVDFDDGTAVDFNYTSNKWRFNGGGFQSTDTRSVNIATTNLGVELPGKYKVGAVQTTQGYLASGFVFNYTDVSNYKYVRQTSQGYQIGQVVSGRSTVLKNIRETVRTDRSYELELHVENQQVSLLADGVVKASVTVDGTLNDGQVGLYTYRSQTKFDDFFVKEIVPTPVAVDDTRQTIVNTPVTLNVVANDSHDVDGTAFSIVSVTQPEHGSVTFDAGAGTVTYTPSADWRGQAEFSYTVADDANVTRSDRGDVLITVAAALPLEVDFDDGTAVDFNYTSNKWRFNGGGFQSTDTRSVNIATTNLGVELPGKYKVGAVQTTQGYLASGFVFNYTDVSNYKYVRQTSQGYQIGQVVSGRSTVLKNIRETVRTDRSYELELHVENQQVSLLADGVVKASVTVDGTLNDGQVGLYTYRSQTKFDDFFVKEIVPTPVAVDDTRQTIVNTPVTLNVVANDYHERDGELIFIESVSGVDNGTVELIDTNGDNKNDQIVFTPDNNYRGIESFTYVITDGDGYQDEARVQITVASELPIDINFDGNSAPDLIVNDNQWTIADEKITAIGRGINIGNILIGEALPNNYEISAQINIQEAGGYQGNAYLMVNYEDNQNYIYAGADQRNGRWVIAQVSNGRTEILVQNRQTIRTRTNYDVKVRVEGKELSLIVDENQRASHTFDANLNQGQVGILTINGRSYIDNIHVDEYVVMSDAEDDRAGARVNETVVIDVLANDYAPNGELKITSVTQPNDATLTLVDSDEDGLDDKVQFVPTADFEGTVTFTYTIEDPKGFIDSATVNVRVADALNYVEDFDDNQAQDFNSVSGIWEVSNQRFGNDGSSDNLTLVDLGQATPAAFEVGVTINSEAIAGKAANGLIVFNYVDPDNYRYAGALVGAGKWVIGETVNGNFRTLTKVADANIATNRDLAISLLYENHTATLRFGDQQVVQRQFQDSVEGGDLGLLARNAITQFDDFYARAVDEAMGDE